MKVALIAALVACGLAVTRGSPVLAETTGSPSVVELFTSQSCYSCPPAEAYLGKLAARSDLIALEFHVDYWNDLVDGTAGRWTDVHSNPAYTARQRAYAERLPGGVYTPQMVIDGRAQAIGSREKDVEAAIGAARKFPRLAIHLATSSAGKTELRLSGGKGVSEGSAGLWLVRFKLREETKVRAGENRGKTLINHHIVTGMTALGPAPLDGETIVLDAFARGLDEGCAILVQAGDERNAEGPILGAALCPARPGKAS